ncbi:receptor-interacting serine/threonine-protein kinase 1 isoform X2 [Brachyhypopomus gauderio]|uniref:receptor-interacting serine/threonine-protein kinase 1 isoform X2 n=1 Tax=Brachyhypopomus gauderio TaxID=698409 RepID=UPI0040418215
MSSQPSSDVSLMNSSDLIKKERLDYGGFGEVYLCYHKTLGQVVLKTVYTGPLRSEQKSCLLKEGSLMRRLRHERVVKLLGVVLEDGDYSLVMELIPKGNLLAMLQSVKVPMSIKGRIILEILEGMVYLTESKVIHKDLKPENILVDEKFHIKIADLGLSTCETWSRLTKEESRRQSHLGCRTSARAAGTLCYMAPEHLDSINTRSTEKSDVYSFSIVVWVILTEHEPYENARSEDQICQCVRKGDRPDMTLVPEDAPEDVVRLMKECWDQDPEKRPTFKESYESLRPVYKEKFEGDVESDLHNLMDLYEGPSELVEKMKSLNTDMSAASAALLDAPSCTPHSGDSPTPLRSAGLGPVEASIEDLRFQSAEDLQADACPAGPASPASPANSASVEQKLAQELNYHKHGSYNHVEQPDLSAYSHSNLASSRWPGEPFQSSSVQSWTKPSPHQEEHHLPAPGATPFEGLHKQKFNTQLSGGHLQSEWHQTQNPQYEHQLSWPGGVRYPLAESAYAETCPGLRVSTPLISPQPEAGPTFPKAPLYINAASGIQIGNNNTMTYQSAESSLSSQTSMTTNSTKYMELLEKYEDHSVSNEHLEIVRENLGGKWKVFARKLGLTEVEIETIEHDYSRDGLAEKVHQMLERWKMKEGLYGCTVGSLCRALENCVKYNVLLNLLLKCQDSTVPG